MTTIYDNLSHAWATGAHSIVLDGEASADVVEKGESSSSVGQLSFSDLLAVFVACSVVGLVVETVVSYPIDGVWKDRAGLLWGPFSPIYGVGGVLMSLVLQPFEGKPAALLWAVAAFAGGAFEYVAGWFWETVFGIVAWSYEGQPFNIGGHTCLGIAIVWGIAGLAWAKIGLPAVVGVWRRVPANVARWLTVALSAFLAIDVAMTFVGFACWFDRQAGETPETPVERYFAQNYGDDFMEQRFQTMSMYTDLAER